MKTGKMTHRLFFTGMLLCAVILNAGNAYAGNKVCIANGNYAFSVKLKVMFVNNKGEVTWQAAKKGKVLRYELEKSTDGMQFNYISAAAGTGASVNKYAIQDRNLSEGNNYYRLKIIDNEGRHRYSEVVSIVVNNNPAITILPATVTDEVFIWLPANTKLSKATITDASGRRVLANAAISNFSNAASVQLGRLPAGLYKVNAVTSNGLTANLKFSKK